MELSLLVPGVTVNAIDTTLHGTGFGQPLFSRESMGQFQVTPNRFDAKLGRGSQIQVNALTKSGTNTFVQ